MIVKCFVNRAPWCSD